MSYDLLDAPLAYIAVRFAGIAIGEGGEAVATEHEVEIQIELLDRDEIVAWMKDAVADLQPEERAEHELKAFRQVAKGWRGVKGNGKVLPFDDVHIEKLLRKPNFVDAFGDAYMKAWQGKVEAREGNSEGSPENGQAGEPTAATPKAETNPS
jgi:hypothetical protein